MVASYQIKDKKEVAEGLKVEREGAFQSRTAKRQRVELRGEEGHREGSGGKGEGTSKEGQGSVIRDRVGESVRPATFGEVY